MLEDLCVTSSRLPIIASFLENHLLQIPERLRTACVCLVWRVKLRSLRCKETNGAGKTTTVRILATLTEADAGRARVAGFDVRRERSAVRRRISVTGQFAALDDAQTGEENLRMMGRLARLSRQGGRGESDRIDRAARPDCASEAAYDDLTRHFAGQAVHRDHASLTLDVPTDGSAPEVRALLDAADPGRTRLASFAVQTASLDDVFLILTRHDEETAHV